MVVVVVAAVLLCLLRRATRSLNWDSMVGVVLTRDGHDLEAEAEAETEAAGRDGEGSWRGHAGNPNRFYVAR